MPLPQIRFTIGRLMIAVAIVAVELGCGSFLVREARQPDSRLDWWSEMIIQLVFLHLCVGILACIFAAAYHNLRLDPKSTKDHLKGVAMFEKGRFVTINNQVGVVVLIGEELDCDLDDHLGIWFGTFHESKPEVITIPIDCISPGPPSALKH